MAASAAKVLVCVVGATQNLRFLSTVGILVASTVRRRRFYETSAKRLPEVRDDDDDHDGDPSFAKTTTTKAK